LTLLNINAVHTFLQIVQNSRKPLEVIREAIANAFDNGASNLDITIEYDRENNSINIILKDNGTGIAKKDIEYYIFGLGNSTKLNADGYIGNKGVGTLLYLKSKRVVVTSFINGKGSRQEWIEPYKSLVEFRDNSHNRALTREDLGIKDAEDVVYSGEPDGTIIEIKGFLHRNPLEYHHENLTDFILWFTKMGSFQNEIQQVGIRAFTVNLKGLLFQEVRAQNSLNTANVIETGYDTYIDKNKILTRTSFETLKYGFPFPPITNDEELIQDDRLSGLDSERIGRELKKDLVLKYTSEDNDFSDFELEFSYTDSLDVIKTAKIDFVVFRVGENIRNAHNTMIKRLTNQLPSYKYLVSERYGIYLAKDFIPVQLINNELQSIGGGGHGKTQYLGFFNCQKIDLTIDRTGAATIDEELQIKLNNRINKLMVKIDGLVNDKINYLVRELIASRPFENPPISPNSEDVEDENNNDENRNPGSDNDENNDGGNPSPSYEDDENNDDGDPSHDSDDDENNDDHNPLPDSDDDRDDTGSTFSEEAEMLEIQEKRTRKAQRIHRINLKKTLTTQTLNGIQLILREPDNESELYGILMQVVALKPDIIAFNILDYNTSKGIDILGRDWFDSESDFSNLFHVELKAKLTSNMNHLLADAKFIICWNIDEALKRSMLLRDKYQNLYRIDQDDEGYILKKENPIHIVKVIELKDIIENHFGQFSVRSQVRTTI
jgi:hypothetical protein